ncbi:hypothetical protein WDW86_21955, partial [Bdellovibrionota bacterium FG-2]
HSSQQLLTKKQLFERDPPPKGLLPRQDLAQERFLRGGEAGGGMAEMVTKLLTKYLSKSLREVALTVFWKRGTGEQSFTVSTYWVDLTHEFELTE